MPPYAMTRYKRLFYHQDDHDHMLCRCTDEKLCSHQLFPVFFVSLQTKQQVDNLMDQAWQNAFVNNQRTLQDLEIRLHCCGYSSMNDRAVPSNCHESPAFGFHTSCQKQLRHSFTRHEDMVIAMVTVVEILQVNAYASFFFVVCLFVCCIDT